MSKLYYKNREFELCELMDLGREASHDICAIFEIKYYKLDDADNKVYVDKKDDDCLMEYVFINYMYGADEIEYSEDLVVDDLDYNPNLRYIYMYIDEYDAKQENRLRYKLDADCLNDLLNDCISGKVKKIEDISVNDNGYSVVVTDGAYYLIMDSVEEE